MPETSGGFEPLRLGTRAKKAIADIFISYAGENRETTKTLAQALADQGWSVWWDRHIPSGRRLHDVIERELTAARCVIALWSTAALDSPWVREEAQEGLDRNILVSARIETVRLPIGFRTVQTTDLSDWKGKPAHPGFMQLVEDIRAVLGEASPETPAPGPEAKRWRPYLALLALLGVITAVSLGYAILELQDYEWRRPTSASVSKPPISSSQTGESNGSRAAGQAGCSTVFCDSADRGRLADLSGGGQTS